MSERKFLDRRVAILFGIICGLAAGLVVGVAINAPLQSRVRHLEEVVDIRCVDFWATEQNVSQPANSYSSWKNEVSYAGFLVVTVVSSTTNNTYVQVKYADYDSLIIYDQRIEVGSSGSARFPILPTYIEVRVGNSDLTSEETETVSIAYVY